MRIGVALGCLAGAGACGRVGFDLSSSADGSAAAIAPSCIDTPPTCGPNGTSACCSAELVPGGTYLRSYDVSGDGDYPDMSDPATVSSFELDTYEVTVGRFRAFLTAGLGTQASPPVAGAAARTLNGASAQAGWDPTWNASLDPDLATLESDLVCDPVLATWSSSPGANDDLPINCITWFEAFAFCAWDGGYLPTEAEWNYAATGGGDQRAYPWSTPAGDVTIDCSFANYSDDSASPPIACPAGPDRVGSQSPKGDGKWGHADLAGNISEWVVDWAADAFIDPCDDCANLADTGQRGIRSGDFGHDASGVRTGFRDESDPTVRYSGYGVRCARAP